MTGKRSWRRVFEETISYVLRDMAHPDGGYRDRAQHVFQMYGAAAAKNPFGFAHLLAARDECTRARRAVRGVKTICP